MAEKRKAGDDQGVSKKPKFDENDIDYLIGDLLKEEAQLVLTRLLRLPNLEDEIRKAIEIVRHARTKLTDQQLKQQLVQFEQLRALQQAAAQGLAMGGAFNFAGAGAFPGFGAGAGKPGVDPTILKSIRAKVRDSFKKSPAGFGGKRGESYSVDEGIVQGELSNAMEKADNGNLRAALEILQGITEEFVERSAHFGESTVDNFNSVMEKIGKAWIEVFLCGDIEAESELTSDERDVWAEKLRSWNKSPEEESILNAARWAGKLGWQDAKLRQVLKGEFTPEEKIEFKEPKRLTQERLLVLERGKHLPQALNLARGLDLNYQEARYLMKMNQPKEAVEAAMKLKVASEVAAIAQVARPIDLDSAFTLGIYCLSLQDQSKMNEMTSWLCDLAIAENKLDELVQNVAVRVKNKDTQNHVIVTLKNKGHPKPALALGYQTLKPFTFDEILALWHEYHPQQQNTNVFGGVVLVPTTRIELIRATAGSNVPPTLANFLWDMAYAFDQANILANLPATDAADKTLDVCLQNVEDAQQLFNLLNNLEAKKQGNQVQRVGKDILDKVIRQEKVDFEFKKENTIARIKYEQEKVIAEAKGELVAPFIPKPVDHPQYNFEDFKGNVCRTLLQSILTAKAILQSLSDPLLAAAAKMTEADLATKVADCDKQLVEVAELAITKIQNPSDLIQIAKDMVNQAEYRLALKIDQKAFAQVKTLDKEREPREAIAQEYGQLKSENDILLSQKLPLAPEKAERLKELYTQVELNNLLPKFARGGIRDYAQLYQQIATLNIETAISSQTALTLTQRLSSQEIADIVDESLAYVKNPSNAASVVKICRDNNEFALVQKVGKLALEKITDLRARLVQRLFIQTELNLLQAEQAELRQLKKELEPEQAARLEELQENYKEVAPFFYELSSCDAYDNLQFSTLENMMVSAIQEVRHLENLLATFPPETPAEKITKTTQDRDEAKKRVPQVFDECLASLASPANALKFARAVENLRQIDLTFKACEHGHSLLPPLYDQSLQRWDVKRDLKALTDEMNELASQKPPQQLPKEKADSQRQLALQVALWETESSFQNESPHQLEQHTLNLATTMSTSIQGAISQTLQKLENLATSLLNPGPIAGNPGVTDAILAAHEVAVRTQKEEKAKLEEELPKLVAQRRKIVEHCLATIASNPRHLQTYTAQISLLEQDSVELITAAAKQTFVLTEKMNDQRIAHSPVIEKIELLSNEAELLDKYRKKLTDAQAAEFAALGREDDRWNYASTRLKAVDLSDLKRDVSVSTLRELQNTKASLESRIAFIATNDALKQIPADLKSPNNDAAQLESRLQKVKLAIDSFLAESLLFVKSPYDINVLCGQFPLDIDPLYRLVRAGFDNTTELNVLYEERAPVYQELRKLEAASEELAALNKQLKKTEQDRLEELRHQRFVFDQEYPYKRVRPETREGFKYKMLSALEAALVTVKANIETRLDAAEDQQKTRDAQGLMQVDGQEDLVALIQQLNAELVQLDGKFETFIQEFAKELKDPQHYHDLASQLLTNHEYELVIKIGKAGHALMLELDAERQRHAEIFRSYFLLQEELYNEKAKNNLLHPTRMEKLKEFEAQVATIVPLKYGVSGVSSSSSSSSKRGYKGGKPPSSSSSTYPTPEDLAVAAQLTESKDVKFNEYPTDWSAGLNHSHLENLVGQVSLFMLSAVTQEKADFLEDILEAEQSGLRGPEQADSPEEKAKREAIEKKLLEITNYTMNTARDFNNNLKLFHHAQAKAENNLLIIIGTKILEQVEVCRQEYLANQEPTRELEKLAAEQRKLVSQRSALPEPEQLRLLALQFQLNLRSVKPSYFLYNPAQYHNFVNDATNTMWHVVYSSREAKEKSLNDMFNAPRLVRGASLTEAQIQEKSQKELVGFEDNIDRVLALSCKFVLELNHVHSMTRKLNSQYRDFKRVLTLGARAQELLKAQLEIQDTYETLLKKKAELEAKQIAGAPQSEALLEVIADIDELLPKLNYGSAQLRNWILDVAEFMIDAARLEKRDKVVLEQIILVFKMKMTPDKFEEVRNLSDPKDWPAVRKELLEYVAKHDTTLPGSPINLKTQLELLLKEGLCNESIDLFPEPDQNDFLNTQRIEILELLWFEVERQKPKELDKILPIIEKYAKKEYQKCNITSLDRLYDSVQQKHADFIKIMYSRGSEILISNLPATKYNLYCDYLKVLKKRLTVDLQVPKEWDAFIAGIRKEHKAKKKLMQLLNVAEL